MTIVQTHLFLFWYTPSTLARREALASSSYDAEVIGGGVVSDIAAKA
jgi:hypothetical protein